MLLSETSLNLFILVQDFTSSGKVWLEMAMAMESAPILTLNRREGLSIVRKTNDGEDDWVDPSAQ